MSRRASQISLYAFVVFALPMYAATTESHLNTTGMGPVYDGVIHFLLSPEDFVPVLALAVLAGLGGTGRR